jgi:hypothetical protein
MGVRENIHQNFSFLFFCIIIIYAFLDSIYLRDKIVSMYVCLFKHFLYIYVFLDTSVVIVYSIYVHNTKQKKNDE